jgi:hypothetical protein
MAGEEECFARLRVRRTHSMWEGKLQQGHEIIVQMIKKKNCL